MKKWYLFWIPSLWCALTGFGKMDWDLEITSFMKLFPGNFCLYTCGWNNNWKMGWLMKVAGFWYRFWWNPSGGDGYQRLSFQKEPELSDWWSHLLMSLNFPCCCLQLTLSGDMFSTVSWNVFNDVVSWRASIWHSFNVASPNFDPRPLASLDFVPGGFPGKLMILIDLDSCPGNSDTRCLYWAFVDILIDYLTGGQNLINTATPAALHDFLSSFQQASPRKQLSIRSDLRIFHSSSNFHSQQTNLLINQPINQNGRPLFLPRRCLRRSRRL